MKLAAEVSDCAFGTRQNNWSLVIRDLTFRLRVDTDEVQVVPNLGHQFVEVPFVLGGDGHIVRHFVEKIKLLD